MNPIRLDGSMPQLLQILTKASLENLKAGDILQGRVQSLDNGMLLLKLMDGAFFTAKVPDGFTANTGDLVTLEIGEKQNDQLTAKIVPNEAGAASPKQSAETNNAQAPQANAIGQKLLALGLAKSDQLMTGVLKLLETDPQMPVDQAAFLTSNSMPADPEMQRMLQKFSENEFEIHANLQTLKDGLLSALTHNDKSEATALVKSLIVNQGIEDLSKALSTLLPKEPAAREAIVQNVRELLNKTLLSELEGSPTSLGNLDSKAVEGIVKNALTSLGQPIANSTPEEASDIPTPDPQQSVKLLEMITKALEDLHTKTKAVDKGDQEVVTKALDKLFDKAAIKAQNGAAEDFDLKEKTKALKGVMDFTQKAVSNIEPKAQEAVLPAFKEIDSAFKFMNQVTTYDSIVQLPLKINQQNTTGELFVMKRKNGKKKIDANNFTLFLSLQTQSLGRIETFLNASQKYVTISFRVEQEDLIKLVKDNHRALYDNLQKKGYKLAEMKCRILELGNTNILDAAKRSKELLGLDSSVDIKI
ncbi:MAG: flagellar hook-length control protein FliK [Clostridia bacterium]|nr:flagellar hook-length control protein FliK [Clostridia bacterium]